MKSVSKESAFVEFCSVAPGLRVFMISRASAEMQDRGMKPTVSKINELLFHLYRNYGNSWDNVVKYLSQ